MLARKSLLLFTVNMIGSALGFLSTIVIARWMGAAALGTVSYLLGLLGMLSVLLDMGFHVAHLKRVSEADEDSAPLIGTFLVIRVALIALFLVAVALLPLVRSYLGRPLFESRAERSVYYAIAAFYVLHALSSVFLHTFEANQQTAKQSLASFAGSLASFLAKVAVAVLGFGVAALGVAYLVEPAVLVAAGIFLFGGYRVARPTRQHLAGYVTYALPLVLNTAVSMITANVNPVLIRAYWTAAQVGYYSSVMGFQIVLERVGLAVMVLFFPQASSDAARGNWDEIRRRLFVIERYLLTILVFLGVVLIAFSKEIVAIALGSEFMPAVPVLICLVISSILAAFFQPYRTVLYAIEKQNYLVLSSSADSDDAGRGCGSGTGRAEVCGHRDLLAGPVVRTGGRSGIWVSRGWQPGRVYYHLGPLPSAGVGGSWGLPGCPGPVPPIHAGRPAGFSQRAPSPQDDRIRCHRIDQALMRQTPFSPGRLERDLSCACDETGATGRG